jgi:excisionase family DNA binding protein
MVNNGLILMKKDQIAQDLFYTVTEVSNFLKVSTKTVRHYITLKLLDAHQFPNNGCYRISKTDLNKFIRGLKHGG